VERPELSISVSQSTSETVVSLAGEIDLSNVARLSATVGDLLTDAPDRVVLDMAGITFCDSQGLGTLIVLSRRANLAHSCIVLTNVGDFLLRVLEITGLRPALMIY
jgi:anti-anti-sigma factor